MSTSNNSSFLTLPFNQPLLVPRPSFLKTRFIRSPPPPLPSQRIYNGSTICPRKYQVSSLGFQSLSNLVILKFCANFTNPPPRDLCASGTHLCYTGLHCSATNQKHTFTSQKYYSPYYNKIKRKTTFPLPENLSNTSQQAAHLGPLSLNCPN